jgi:hypothetical protein
VEAGSNTFPNSWTSFQAAFDNNNKSMPPKIWRQTKVHRTMPPKIWRLTPIISPALSGTLAHPASLGPAAAATRIGKRNGALRSFLAQIA